jgi:hypothetical protein
MIRKSFAAVGVAVTLAAALATAAPASAKGAVVTKSGKCSATSTWKLKAKPNNGKIEVEYEVDSNKVGQTWAWRLADNGVRVASGKATTVAPSGSFTVKRMIANKAGADKIVGKASLAATGETCSGTVTL